MRRDMESLIGPEGVEKLANGRIDDLSDEQVHKLSEAYVGEGGAEGLAEKLQAATS